jgi:hypothetical protein
MPKQKLTTAPGGVPYRHWNGCDSWNWPASTLMDPSHLSQDFREFLTCLNEAGVEYLVVSADLIANKKASGRLKDLADVEQLKAENK